MKDEVLQIREGCSQAGGRVLPRTHAHGCTGERPQPQPGSGMGAGTPNPAQEPMRWGRSQPGGGFLLGTRFGVAARHLLLQVERGLPIEALVLGLHVSEAREVVGVHEGEVDLGSRAHGRHPCAGWAHSEHVGDGWGAPQQPGDLSSSPAPQTHRGVLILDPPGSRGGSSF